MSAPEVGDRVRVIAGQWTGWDGVVLCRLHIDFLRVRLTSHVAAPLTFTRTLPCAEVETVPTTPDSTPESDERGADVGLDPEAANGAQGGST